MMAEGQLKQRLAISAIVGHGILRRGRRLLVDGLGDGLRPE
jgi:hypothetical protein